jgi:hypothetical protein
MSPTVLTPTAMAREQLSDNSASVAKPQHAPPVASAHSSPIRTWKPILTGVLDQRATDAWRRILTEVNRRAASFPVDPSLASGGMGLAIPFAYAAQADVLPDAEASAVQWLERGMSTAHEARGLSLYGGLAGIGWTVAHLTGGDDAADDTNFSALDAALRYQLDVAPADQRVPYDLVSGVVGWGIYALQRLPSPTARQLLELAIDRLAQLAVPQIDGIAWLTPSSVLPNEQQLEFPEGYLNLGIAHGVPGVIGLLSRAIEKGVAANASMSLLTPTVEWLLAQQLPGHELGAFGYYTAPGKRASDVSRLGWCYGDLGNSLVIAHAAAATGNDEWRDAAHRLALRAARRTALTSGVEDAGLCHGAAGNAHLFNRLFQHFGDDELHAAAVNWFARTFAFEGRGRGIGGYAAWLHRGAAGGGWVDDPGLLEGATGGALALLAGTTDVEPVWDAMLLADLRVG